MNKKYNFPHGVNRLQSLISTYKILQNPIALVTARIKRFGRTYSAIIPGKGRVIITQDAGFINYVFRENHTNYHKADLVTKEVVKQLEVVCFFQMAKIGADKGG
jgi:hypothetical protein